MSDSVLNSENSTYIMKHQYADKYYVGKTNNIARRMIEHTKDRWSKDSVHERVTMLRIVNRIWHTISNYTLIWSVRGDYEKNIKSFGVRKFMIAVRTGSFINCVQGGSTLS